MALRMSTLFLRTLREDPADAEVPSHRLLVRAGYIRRVSPGIYTWLPLGLRVLRRVETIVREEMDAIGAQELLFPALLPARALRGERSLDGVRRQHLPAARTARAPTTCSGRPTRRCSPSRSRTCTQSYKDLPLAIYQIQTKYRDEARPRAGVLRGREFVMKDSLLLRHRRGRARQEPTSCTATPTSASSTGSASTTSSSRRWPGPWAAARARSSSPPPRTARTPTSTAPTAATPRTSRPCASRSPTPCRMPGVPAAHAEDTPDTPTIETLVAHLNAHFPRDGPALGRRRHPQERHRHARPPRRHPRAAGHRRARRPRDRREAARAPRSSRPTVEAFDEKDFARQPGPGQGLHRARARSAPRRRPRIRYLLDPRVVEGTRWVTGADEAGQARHRPRGRPRLHRRRHHRGRRGARRRRLPELRARAGVGPRHRDGPHLPARHQVRRGARPQGARPERQAADRDDGLLRRRVSRAPSPASPRATTTSSACAGRARSAPADVHIVATGKDATATPRSSPRPRRSPARSRRRASRCSTTTARRSAPA